MRAAPGVLQNDNHALVFLVHYLLHILDTVV